MRQEEGRGYLIGMAIGVCYGVQMTCLVLRFAQLIVSSVFMWGQIVFLVGMLAHIAYQVGRWQASK